MDNKLFHESLNAVLFVVFGTKFHHVCNSSVLGKLQGMVANLLFYELRKRIWLSTHPVKHLLNFFDGDTFLCEHHDQGLVNPTMGVL